MFSVLIQWQGRFPSFFTTRCMRATCSLNVARKAEADEPKEAVLVQSRTGDYYVKNALSPLVRAGDAVLLG